LNSALGEKKARVLAYAQSRTRLQLVEEHFAAKHTQARLGAFRGFRIAPSQSLP